LLVNDPATALLHGDLDAINLPVERRDSDWRLRECDYRVLNRQPAAELHRDRRRYLDTPYPGGESWRQAIGRVGRFLPDLRLRWEGARVLIIGHVATRWALDHLLDGVPVEYLIAREFGWREGWATSQHSRENEDWERQKQV